MYNIQGKVSIFVFMQDFCDYTAFDKSCYHMKDLESVKIMKYLLKKC